MTEGSRLVLMTDVVMEMLLAAERAADPDIIAHHIDYGREHRELVTYFVPSITVERKSDQPPPADPAQLPETG